MGQFRYHQLHHLKAHGEWKSPFKDHWPVSGGPRGPVAANPAVEEAILRYFNSNTSKNTRTVYTLAYITSKRPVCSKW